MNKTSEGHASSVRILKDVAELKRLAKEATPGPWFVVGQPWNPNADFIVAGSEDPHIGQYVADTEDFDGEGKNVQENAAYIAAANPAVILELLAQRDELLKALRGLLIAETAVFPAFNEGMAAQDQWSMNRANAHDAARAAIAKAVTP